MLEMRVRTDVEPSSDRLAELGSDAFPNRQELYLVQGQFALEATNVGASASRQLAGFAFKSVDEKSLFTARADLFAFSRYDPYMRWQSFRDEAQHHWARYRAGVNPTGVHRVALRYINKIVVPTPNIELKDFLRTYPEVSPDLPQSLAGYVMRVEIPYPEFEANVIVNQTVLPPETPDSAAFLLDIDVFQFGDPPISDEDAWERFEQLRTAKNRVFEACITQRTRELFQ